jgi:hypothetical protein
MTIHQIEKWAQELVRQALNHGHSQAFAVYIDLDAVGEAYNMPVEERAQVGGYIHSIPVKSIPEETPGIILMYVETDCYPFLGLTFSGDMVEYYA